MVSRGDRVLQNRIIRQEERRMVLHMKGCLIQRHRGHCVTWTLEETTSENDKSVLILSEWFYKKWLVKRFNQLALYFTFILFFFLSEDLIYKRNYRNEFGQINYSFVNTLSSLFEKDPLWPLRQMVLRRNFSLGI